jgi:chaperonin GroES
MPKGRPKKDTTAPIADQAQPVKIGVKPLMGYVLVEPSEAETKTASGLYLPETAQEKPAGQGVVVSLGDPVFFEGKEILPPVQLGDKVIYKKWGGDEIKYQGKEYKLVEFKDLMAVITD